MPIFQTNGFFLHSIPYSENSKILKFYCYQYGLISMFARNANGKKNNIQSLQNLDKVELRFRAKKPDFVELPTFHSVSLINFKPRHLYEHSIAQFISELILIFFQIKHEEEEILIFLEEASEKTLNTKTYLDFLWKICEVRGIFPTELTNIKEEFLEQKSFFNLEKNNYELKEFENDTMGGAELKLLKKYLNELDFLPNQIESKMLLDISLRYLKIHLPEYKTPKTLKVLQSIYA